MTENRKVPIIFLGLGNVGSALLRQVLDTRDALAQRANLRLSPIALADVSGVLFDPDGLPEETLRAALDVGCGLVLANKIPLAGPWAQAKPFFEHPRPNTPPSALNVTISPSDPSAPPATTRHPALARQIGLTVTYSYHDDDDESEPLVQIRWYRNDKLQIVKFRGHDFLKCPIAFVQSS